MVEHKLVAEQLSKRYGGVQALDRASLRVRPGSIHAVVGQNGAGKSTLMKALVGNVMPDEGRILVDGRPVRLGDRSEARRNGIAIVYQELSVFPDRTVLENLFVGNFATRWGLMANRRMQAIARPVLEAVGLDVPLDVPMDTLSVGERQLTEISRVLLRESSVLILDEPTSALRDEEVERLFAVVRGLRDEGVSILYVSHRLDEIFALADTVTVMREGVDVVTTAPSDTSPAEVVVAMLGRDPGDLYPPRLRTDSLPAEGLTVRGLASGPLVDLDVRVGPGEIVGIAGVQGSGYDRVLPALFGVMPATAREASFPDGRGLPHSSGEAVRRGVALVPGERQRHGLMLDKSVAENLSHVRIGAGLSGRPMVSRSELTATAEHQVDDLSIRVGSIWNPVDSLSGGNQQKVVVGKWLAVGPEVILLDDPTRGIDVGAKSELFDLVRTLAKAGGTVLFRSTEAAELAGLCDRVVIVHQGRGVFELSGDELTAAEITHAATTGARMGRAVTAPDPQSEKGYSNGNL